jgi:hypothetical protein
MNKHLLNVFRVSGLESLSAPYRLADVIGLDPEQHDFHTSADRLTGLSRTLGRPITFLHLSDGPVIVYPDGTPIPTTRDLGTRIVSLRPRRDVVHIDFTKSSEYDPIRLRIVRYLIEQHLTGQQTLWQPGRGQAFFERVPTFTERDTGLYVGTRVRPVVLPDGAIGICVDKTSRLLSVKSLPLNMSRETFDDRWKGQRCIYRLGDSWYEIRIEMLSRHDLSTHPIRQGNGHTTLYNWILDNVRKPVSAEIAALNRKGSVVVYRNQRGEERSAPAQLCFPVRDTEDVRRTRLSQATIPGTQDRFDWSAKFTARNLAGRIEIGSAGLSISALPETDAVRVIPVPDLKFGNSAVLSVQGTTNARQVNLRELGRQRIELLSSPKAGLLITAPLARQYLVIPKTAHASFGAAYADDLRAAVCKLHPTGGYEPELVVYDDTGPRTFAVQARALGDLLAVQRKPGYAVVMVHRCRTRDDSDDPLAAFVLRRFFARADIVSSVVHYDTAARFYETHQQGDGARVYRVRADQRNRVSGYFRNVALNKILLTNQNWPFGLAQRLHADLTIGIDIKNNACCLLAVGEFGSRITSRVHVSKQKEKLNERQLQKYLQDLLIEESRRSPAGIRSVVLHRDGRAWSSEISGARRALEVLKAEKVLPEDCALTVLELHKRSSIPLRLFQPGSGENGASVQRPQIGTAWIASREEAFVCTTGAPFAHPGTPSPLQVFRAYGTLPIEMCAEDVFRLSTLAWSRPEDCSRYPVTLKLADRFLADEAAVYDEDALQFGEYAEAKGGTE